MTWKIMTRIILKNEKKKSSSNSISKKKKNSHIPVCLKTSWFYFRELDCFFEHDDW